MVFNIALSTVAATIFYFITVFLPYKKRYTDVSVFLLREYRGIIRLITHFELFLRGCTNSFEKEVNMDLVCEKFLNISNEGKAWENLFNQMCDICSTVDDFVRSYDEFLSAEVKEKAVRLHDNNAFYIALNTKNYREATKILRVSKSLGEYYCAAMNFAKLGNIMLNSK